MPVYQFQHLGGARLDVPVVTRLGLEPRTLSLKVRCSNQLSYQVFSSIEGGKDSQFFYRANFCDMRYATHGCLSAINLHTA